MSAPQAVVFVASGSVALLADLIHNAGDAATALPLGAAFALRSARTERRAGLAVVAAIFVSACVAGYEAIDRLVNPKPPDALGALALAGVLGLRRQPGGRADPHARGAGARQPRTDRRRRPRSRRRLRQPRGRRQRGGRRAGLDVGDPLIGLAITAVILRITWQSWRTVAGHRH
jgi:divalent metal cation (Fe/Co/Zn/Cd) transporter